MSITARRLTPVASTSAPTHRMRRLYDPAPVRAGLLELEFAGPGTGTDGPAPLPATLPDPEDWARTVTVAILEAQGGQRPAHQVTKWLSASVAKTVARRAETAQRRRVVAGAVHVVRIHAQQLPCGAIEAGMCVRSGGRYRAAAVRLEPHRTRWVVTAFELG